jgi:hypothetical protein
MVFIKHVFGIILSIQKSPHATGPNGIWNEVEVVGVQVVGLHEVPDHETPLVVTRFTDKRGRYLEATSETIAFKVEPPGYGDSGLIVRKQNVKDGLSDAYVFCR